MSGACWRNLTDRFCNEGRCAAAWPYYHGMCSDCGILLLPTVIKTFSKQYPHIRLRIRDLTANEGLQAVARGEVEFGINLMGNSDPDLAFEPLIDDPFVLAMRKDHPLAAFETIQWDQLGHTLWWLSIVPAATGRFSTVRLRGTI